MYDYFIIRSKARWAVIGDWSELFCPAWCELMVRNCNVCTELSEISDNWLKLQRFYLLRICCSLQTSCRANTQQTEPTEREVWHSKCIQPSARCRRRTSQFQDTLTTPACWSPWPNSPVELSSVQFMRFERGFRSNWRRANNAQADIRHPVVSGHPFLLLQQLLLLLLTCCACDVTAQLSAEEASRPRIHCVKIFTPISS